MKADQAGAESMYDKQIAEFRSKYGPKRELVRAMWEHRPPAGVLAFEDHCAERWDSAAESARRSLLQRVLDTTVEMAQQGMPNPADKHKMKVIITTCLTDVVNKADALVTRSFKEPGGLLEVCHMVLRCQENAPGAYPEQEIEQFLQRLNYDVFNELNRNPEQHRVMLREFRSMYCVEWLIAFVGRLE